MGYETRNTYQMPVRMPKPIGERVKAHADLTGVSRNALVVRYITEGLARDDRAEGLIRDGLAAAAEQIDTDPDALIKITRKLRDR